MRRRAGVVLGVVVMLEALAALALVLHARAPQASSRARPAPAATAALAQAPVAYPSASSSPLAPPRLPPTEPRRLLIPRIGVDSAVVLKGIDSHGNMQAPDTPADVAWYPFTSRPGAGGNAVFAGHLIWYGGATAVFGRLSELQTGDGVDVRDEVGKTLRYRVTSKASYELSQAPVPEIVGPTSVDSVTIITCAGSWVPATGLYSRRLVVRAEAMEDVQ